MTLYKHSAVFTDLVADEMYVATGDQIRPWVGGDSTRTGVWKTPKVRTRQYPAFGWLRVNGPMTSTAVVRVYGDGVLVHTTPAISTRDPVRLPAGRYAMMEFEIESDGPFTSVVLASTAEELTRV